MKFDLIDRVLDQQPDRLTAVKAVTTAEEYLGDHFPGFAVLPGVMMLETLVQAARKLAAAQGADESRPLVLTTVRNLRYGNMVRPGQSLTVEVTLRGRSGDDWEFQGVGSVEGQVAVQGRFMLQPLAWGG